MRRLVKMVLPVVVLGIGIAVAATLMVTGPKAERRQPPPPTPMVEVITVQPTDYQVSVETRGTVSPRTQSTLIPEVSGRIVEIAAGFRNGGFFEQGDALVTIDRRDYENAVTVARAELAQGRLRLEEEQAEAEQALRDWGKLGDGATPPPLVVRKPQLASARAAVAAAEARLRQAELNLERTVVRAPYVGRVLDKRVDVGQYVTSGTVLATVYAVDYVEIRLPVTDEQQAFLDLPEAYREVSEVQAPGMTVTLSARVGRQHYQWQGRIVRAEGAIDTQSRQLFVVAQVDDPYSLSNGLPPLKVGQFVIARIAGERLDDVFVIPRKAVRGNGEVFVVNEADRIERRQLDIVWRDVENVVAIRGVEPGERLSLTPLPSAPDGAKVRIEGEAVNGRAQQAPGQEG